MKTLQIFPVEHVPPIHPGDPLPRILLDAIRESGLSLMDNDVLAVCQKIVSKSEGRIVDLRSVTPSSRARDWADRYEKDPRMIEVVLGQAQRIVRMEQGIIIAETPTGLICANAGVDQSNAPGPEHAVLLPEDPDASAEKLRREISARTDYHVAIVITDTFGRPWREGQVDVAIGVAGLRPLLDLRGKLDWTRRRLEVTLLALADQIAAAAGLTLQKDAGTPAAIVRGIREGLGEGKAAELIRPAEKDLFR
jgi:coenzyme F420-0:L-glutamate ligase/coenzyme F420-1:gamma-L-glutamate ligase